MLILGVIVLLPSGKTRLRQITVTIFYSHVLKSCADSKWLWQGSVIVLKFPIIIVCGNDWGETWHSYSYRVSIVQLLF